MLDSDAEVGRVVAQLRGERTQQSVAAAMRDLGWRWSQATVWGVEKGERPLKLREAVVLASILGANVETLVGVDPDLVFLSNRLTWVHQKINVHKGQVAGLEQQLVEAEKQLERTQQERLVLEDAFRNGVKAGGGRADPALLAYLDRLGTSVLDLLDEQPDDQSGMQ